jgi:hypothetical protein
MENLINKIEQYEIDNNKKWIELMKLDIEAMHLPMAQLIGAMTSQLEIIKNELQNGKYIQLEKEFEEYRNEFKYCIKDMEYCFKDARAGEDGEAKYFTFTDYINRFKK